MSGVASVKTNDTTSAIDALREFCRREPGGLETGWAKAYADWTERGTAARVHALLIGIGSYAGITPLDGPPNDIKLLPRLLMGKGAKPP